MLSAQQSAWLPHLTMEWQTPAEVAARRGYPATAAGRCLRSLTALGLAETDNFYRYRLPTEKTRSEVEDALTYTMARKAELETELAQLNAFEVWLKTQC